MTSTYHTRAALQSARSHCVDVQRHTLLTSFALACAVLNEALGHDGVERNVT